MWGLHPPAVYSFFLLLRLFCSIITLKTCARAEIERAWKNLFQFPKWGRTTMTTYFSTSFQKSSRWWVVPESRTIRIVIRIFNVGASCCFYLNSSQSVWIPLDCLLSVCRRTVECGEEKKILSSIRLVAKRQRSRKVCKNTKNRKVGSYNVTL